TQPATGETYPKSDLFNKAPLIFTRTSGELQKILELIEDTDTSLIKDSRYLRLIALVEKN
ncbi:hypothetical protein, partial [Escherichia coli]|uniref:hypothetical protein n=1 Tax=Escherichia coli TaxID=562 RepID=UPI000A83772C